MSRGIGRLSPRHYNHTELRALREHKGKTIFEVAEALGVDHQKIGRAERGDGVTYEFLCDLARYYRRPVTYFLYAEPLRA